MRQTQALPDVARAYLDELDHQLRDLPRERRREVVADIAAHIAAELSLSGPVAGVLARLGPPDEIARAARTESPPARSRVPGRDVAAIVLLLVGGFALGVGWIVGLVLLWTSSAWRVRDKVLGTLLVPGGLVSAVLAFSLAWSNGAVGVGCGPTVGTVTSSAEDVAGVESLTSAACVGNGGAGPSLLAILVGVFTVGGPIFTAIWLGVRARRAARG